MSIHQEEMDYHVRLKAWDEAMDKYFALTAPKPDLIRIAVRQALQQWQ